MRDSNPEHFWVAGLSTPPPERERAARAEDSGGGVPTPATRRN
jgi:hypothetical protein